MNIEIKNRFTGNIIIAGEYGSIRDALEKNRGADLRGANLRGANMEVLIWEVLIWEVLKV